MLKDVTHMVIKCTDKHYDLTSEMLIESCNMICNHVTLQSCSYVISHVYSHAASFIVPLPDNKGKRETYMIK